MKAAARAARLIRRSPHDGLGPPRRKPDDALPENTLPEYALPDHSGEGPTPPREAMPGLVDKGLVAIVSQTGRRACVVGEHGAIRDARDPAARMRATTLHTVQRPGTAHPDHVQNDRKEKP